MDLSSGMAATTLGVYLSVSANNTTDAILRAVFSTVDVTHSIANNRDFSGLFRKTKWPTRQKAT